MSKLYNIAVVGATGMVGKEIVKLMEEENFPLDILDLYASNKSIGKQVSFKDKNISVNDIENADFSKYDLAFFCTNNEVSKKYIPLALRNNCKVIDKSSAFRMDSSIPLIVPEVNESLISDESQIVANPNCCVIPLSVALKPLDNAAKIKRLVISTYQSTSGAGKSAMDELYDQTKAKFVFNEQKSVNFPKPIAFNLFPHIGEFDQDGNCDEENKISEELNKIIGNHFKTSVTTVRVPVFVSHSMSVNIEFDKSITAQEAYEILEEEEAIILSRPDQKTPYITPVEATCENAVFVSRIRQDHSISGNRGLNLWICCDNIRKGAAYNAFQIADKMLKL